MATGEMAENPVAAVPAPVPMETTGERSRGVRFVFPWLNADDEAAEEKDELFDTALIVDVETESGEECDR